MSESCATFDCPHDAVAEAWVAEAGPQGEGEWARYCRECAGVLERGGDIVRWDTDFGKRAKRRRWLLRVPLRGDRHVVLLLLKGGGR